MLNPCIAELKMGSYRNIVLQKEWQHFGFENFEFKELEIPDPTDDPTYGPAEDLLVLKTPWIEKLSPFGDREYNKPPKAGA
jgi:hypothetical protein